MLLVTIYTGNNDHDASLDYHTGIFRQITRNVTQNLRQKLRRDQSFVTQPEILSRQLRYRQKIRSPKKLHYTQLKISLDKKLSKYRKVIRTKSLP